MLLSGYGKVNMELTPVLNAMADWTWYAEARWFNMTISVLVAVATFFLVNRSVQHWGLLGRLSNVPLFIAVVCFFTMPSTLNSAFLWICTALMVQLVGQLMRMLNGIKTNSSAFGASAMVGLLLLFYPAFLTLYLAVLSALLMAGEFNLRRWLITVIGLLLPSYFLFSVLYLLEIEMSVDVQVFLPSWQKIQLYSEHWWTVLYALFIAGCAMLVSAGQMGSSTLREKRKWQLVVLLFVLGFAAAFFAGPDLIMAVSFVPAVIIAARLFANHPTRWLVETLFVVLLGFVAINLLN